MTTQVPLRRIALPVICDGLRGRMAVRRTRTRQDPNLFNAWAVRLQSDAP